MTAAPGSGGIKVLIKAMSILNLLAEEPTAELPLSEISARLRLNKSTCHHILDTLAGGDYIEKTSPGRYKLGIRLFLTGSRLLDQLDVRERAQTPMSEAQRRLGETVFLYIKRGDEAVCVERLDGHYSSTHQMRIGDALPLHVGASPKVFLAAESDAQIESYLDRARANPSERFSLDPAALWRDIEFCRTEGYVMSARDIENNTLAIGTSIKDHTGTVVGALSISWVEQLSSNSEESIVAQLLETAERISYSLGHLPTTTRGIR